VVLVAIEAKYTAPLQVVETEQMRDAIKAISDAEHVSQASVIRDILDGTRPHLVREDPGGVGGV
jgi:hypothetical protein